MELRQLQCLVECAKTQSFSQAATLLFTTQSNVSKMISSLEDELGHKLFERKQRGIVLTEKGRQVYHYALSIVECSQNLLDCMAETNTEELHICFQPSSWLAAAFCDFYLQNHNPDRRYFMKNATVDEIIRRLSNHMDQLGIAYIEESWLSKLKSTFKTNRLAYKVLKRLDLVCCYGGEADPEPDQKEIPLIQNFDDDYSGLSLWKDKLEQFSPNVVITTDSEAIFREILSRTELSTIGADYPSHVERSLRQTTISLMEDKASVVLVCLYPDDRPMEELTQEFLDFICNYIEE